MLGGAVRVASVLSLEIPPMKRRLASRSTRLAFASLFCVALSLAYFPIARILAASSAPVVTLRRGSKPFVNAQSAHSLEFTYTGKADAVAALQAGAKSVSLTSADFDADGAPDLVAGYSTAKGGVVTVTRGNPDAFAPRDPSLYALALQGKVPPEFLNKAVAFSVPGSPDFLATGDFNGDGYKDLLVGTRGGGLYLLAGDGHGNLAAPKLVALPGTLSALAVNGAGHVAAALESRGVAQLLVFDPRSSSGFSQPVATQALSAPATSMEWGRLGINTSDLAVAAGRSVVVFYSALSPSAQSETINLTVNVQALTIGNFTWNRDGRMEIAALGDDGSVHILQHGTLDTRRLTAADIPGRRAQARQWSRKPAQDPTSLGAWEDARQIAGATTSTAGVAPQAMLQVSHLVPASTFGLMALDGAQGQVNVLDTSTAATGPHGLAISGTPVAAHALPAMLNGGRSLVVLTSSSIAPILMDSGTDPTFSVNTPVDEDNLGACTDTTITNQTETGGVLSLREAVCEANNNGAATDIINVQAGTYELTSLETGELQLGAPDGGAIISIVGAGASTTIIQQTDGVDRIIEQDFPLAGSNPLTISNLTLSGGSCTTGTDCTYGGGAILGTGTISGDDLTLNNVVLNNNSSGAADDGGAISAGPIGNLTITYSTISDNTATDADGGGLFVTNADDSGDVVITNCTITGNTVTGGADGGGLAILPGTGNTATISGSTFTGNQATGTGSEGGAIFADLGVTVTNSLISGNSAISGGGGFYESGGAEPGSVNHAFVTSNWWGCNGGPNTSGCDTVGADSGATATSSPWLVLSLSANPTQIGVSSTSTLTADITHNSDGAGGFSIPDGTIVLFGGTLGTAEPTGTTTDGQATSVFTSGTATGLGSGTAQLDNQTVSATITIGAGPAITSANNTTFFVGISGSFTVTATGSPTPSLSASSLPNGVSFVDNGNGTGTLSGTPTSSGVFAITITAANSLGVVSQSFVLTVSAPQFQLTTSASPLGSGSVTPTSGNYTAGSVVALSATPAAGYAFLNWTSSPGSVANPTSANTTITMSAAESVTANFQAYAIAVPTTTTVTSSQNPSFTSAPNNSVTITATVTVTAGGSPVGTNGSVTFTDGGNPVAGCVAGPVALNASGQVSCTTTSLIEEVHTITATYSGELGFTTSYSPSVGTFSQEVDSHTVVTVNGNVTQYCNPGGITASAPGAATPYPSNIFVSGSNNIGNLTITLNNLTSSDMSAIDTLLVGPTGAAIVPLAGAGGASNVSGLNITLADNAGSLLPAIYPSSGTYRPSSLTGSTTLSFPAPAPAISEVNFPATDGTTTLAETFNNSNPNGTWALYFDQNPANGTGTGSLGSWCLNFTASAVPAITSASSATFMVGVAGSFTVTATGEPTPSLSASALPSGITFVDNGNGTGTLSGTPTVSGAFGITFTASNGAGSTTQSFTLTVDQAPVITSASNTTFLAGVPSSFTVTTSGFPTPSLTEVGALPALFFVNNGNGTGTLAGTPTPGGVYNLTFTATNGVGSVSQSFALTVSKAVTTTTLVSSKNPTKLGVVPTLTATVTSTGALPTGKVEFMNGTKLLATKTLTGGVATYAPSLAAGTYVITAVYEGDSNNSGSTSAPLTQVILALTTTKITSPVSPATSSFGQPVTFTAVVTSSGGPPANGEPVLFQQGSLVLCSATLTGGTASCTTSTLTLGTKLISAVYGGDASLGGSTSSSITLVVGKASTTTVLTSSVNPSIFQQEVVLTVTVTSEFGTTVQAGPVTITDGSTVKGQWPLSDGTVSIDFPKLSEGTHNLTATFNGNTNYQPSSSSTLVQTVNPPPPPE